MDTMNFLIGVIIMMLAASYGAFWLVGGTAIVLLLTMRSWRTLALIVCSLAIIFFFQGQIEQFAPYILFGLVILAMALGNTEQQPQEAGFPDMGGLGGLGGMGGMGGGYA